MSEEEKESEESTFNNSEKCVGMIYVLENLQQRFELTEIEREIIEYAKKLINNEYEETVGISEVEEEEDDVPIHVPKGIEIGVKTGKVREVYGYV